KQTETGWTPDRIAFRDEAGATVAAVSVLMRRVGPLRVLYVPKGPALDYGKTDHLRAVLDHLEALARQRRAIWLKIDPDVIAGTGIPGSADSDRPPQDDPAGQGVLDTLRGRGWRFSESQVQFRNTVTLDLSQSEDDLLAGMSQGTRRKVRTGPKKDVTVREASGEADFQTLYDLYRVTGERQGFLIRPPEYYREAWARFMAAGLATAFLAEWEGRALAGLVLFHFGPKAWYFYGMSSDEERNRMPTYALQWAAIRWARERGYPIYDFWGAPDTFREDDPMWGVYRFKDGFGGRVVRHIGAWDYVPNRVLYWAYERLMPRVLAIMRRGG
ncbi:MAG: peptidoglycan bridge formation glycyltransferase FemA/FemB family protein, partial [Anaerolineae bacterium]|nr:peptidoglycan bridge formation glycyltransferase FemA/FemB family protein [Anaerolineae bacterium]